MKFFSWAFVLFVLSLSPAFAADKTRESAYDRVMRTGTIRCGIVLWPTYIEKDPNSGALSGLWYDYMEALASSLHLKIEWMPETTYPQMPEDLQSGRYDVFCGGLWPDAELSRSLDFTIPISYQVVQAFVRADDRRFDGNLAAINDKAVRVSVIDGLTPDIIRREDFPESTPVSLPQSTDVSQTFLEIVNNKADITFNSPETAERFTENNPGKLRQVETDAPLRLYPEVLAVRLGEDKLRRMLDNATVFLLNDGRVEKLLKKYETHGGHFYRVAKPYVVPE